MASRYKSTLRFDPKATTFVPGRQIHPAKNPVILPKYHNQTQDTDMDYDDQSNGYYESQSEPHYFDISAIEGRRRAIEELRRRAFNYPNQSLTQLAQDLTKEIRQNIWLGYGATTQMPITQKPHYASEIVNWEGFSEEMLGKVLAEGQLATMQSKGFPCDIYPGMPRS